jgi:hypothetical protein
MPVHFTKKRLLAPHQLRTVYRSGFTLFQPVAGRLRPELACRVQFNQLLQTIIGRGCAIQVVQKSKPGVGHRPQIPLKYHQTIGSQVFCGNLKK